MLHPLAHHGQVGAFCRLCLRTRDRRQYERGFRQNPLSCTLRTALHRILNEDTAALKRRDTPVSPQLSEPFFDQRSPASRVSARFGNYCKERGFSLATSIT